ncbi:methyl-accepting chemotaxis protein [Halobacillus salinarum]|uniref:Methyl-accepting chemotaxis protein n=1 Tax=Halobacillus salinarum TaxID=2932257 RepID=A0ABY4EL33_9BACI|nr:HAMP domain-containing methyl-accepting chemotaxis protein [Halobacillus salinarum]UOQ45120.1 methyl-accepting chemotaxis protein [Halobacillus salinarum]
MINAIINRLKGSITNLPRLNNAKYLNQLKLFTKLNLKKKVLLMFLPILLVSTLSFLLIIYQIQSLKEDVNALKSSSNYISQLSNIQSFFQKETLLLNRFAINQDDSFVNEYKSAEKEFEQLISALESNPLAKSQASYINSIKTNHEEMKTIILTGLIPQIITYNQSGMEESQQELENKSNAIFADFSKMIEETKNQNDAIELSSSGSFQKVIVSSILSSLILIASLGLLYWFFSKMIVKPIIQLSALTDRISEGDLGSEKVKISSKDEIGSLQNSLNSMIDHLKEIIQQSHETANHVSHFSAELNKGAEEIYRSTSHVSTAIEQVNEGVEQQLSQNEKNHEKFHRILAEVEQIKDKSNFVFEQSSLATDEAEDGNSLIVTTDNDMNEISQSVQKFSEVIQELEKRSNEISSFVEIINKISKQTNLLALNATIEASRAGVHGKGFSVVANEVKDLAEKSRLSAEEITEVIGSIQNDVQQSSELMSVVLRKTEQGITNINKSGKKFDQIYALIKNITSNMKGVSHSSNDIYTNSQDVLYSLKESTSSAKESKSQMNHVSASSGQQLSFAEEISHSIVQLNNSSQELEKLLSRFSV